jgi:competence/damage-inducible protein CinA-like protein
MPSAEIITIGTEILLGEIIDTNAAYIARKLRDVGVNLYRKTTVGDNASRIALAIQQAMERADIIITTGGLGPTVDDPTREAVAMAMGVETEFQTELWDQIQARFRRYGRPPTENNRRQAFIPHGAIAIENPVGTAPSFICEAGQKAVISLPGVPREMEYLLENAVLPYLRSRYDLRGLIKARVLHTAGIGESIIDERISDLETLSNPTVGLAAHSGQVDVRITVRADSEPEADAMIQDVERQVRERLGKWIYGADEETLEDAVLNALARRGWSLVVVEAGLGGELTRRLAKASTSAAAAMASSDTAQAQLPNGSTVPIRGAETASVETFSTSDETVQEEARNRGSEPFRGGNVLTQLPEPESLIHITEAYRAARRADVALGVAIYPSAEVQVVHLSILTPENRQDFQRPYGGPPEYAPRWALHHSLDILRSL